MMKIQIREQSVKVTRLLRAHIARRLAFALSRFGEQIGLVTVHFSKPTGPGNGADHRCQIVVGLRPRKVRAEDTDLDMFAALNNASDRLSRSVGRALEQERNRHPQD